MNQKYHCLFGLMLLSTYKNSLNYLLIVWFFQSHLIHWVRFVVGTRLYCFHLYCLSLYGPNTYDNLFETFEKAMDASCPSWVYTLLSTCSNGARNMIVQVRGIVIHVFSQVEREGCYLIWFWCGAHQLDLVVQNVISDYLNIEFYTTLTAIIRYLHRQQNLINECELSVQSLQLLAGYC